MYVLITGSSGFVGKNLTERLSREEDVIVLKYDKENTLDQLEAHIQKADFIFHLAGVNRSERTEEFYEGNSGLTQKLIACIEKADKCIPVLISSSIQAECDNDYGKRVSWAANKH